MNKKETAYKEIVHSILALTTVEDVIEFGKRYYGQKDSTAAASIFSRCIIKRKCNPDSSSSIKNMVNASLLFMSQTSNPNGLHSWFRKLLLKPISGNLELSIFKIITKKLEELYLDSEIQMSSADGLDTSIIANTFINVYFNYQSLNIANYAEYFKFFSEESKKIYGFNVADKLPSILMLTSKGYPQNAQENQEFPPFFSKKQMLLIFDSTNLDSIDKLFVDAKQVQQINKLDKISDELIGKIGLKFPWGYYVPRNEMIMENILAELQRSPQKSGHPFERLVEYKVREFFQEYDLETNYYLQNEPNEKDIIVFNDKNIVIIECKLQNLKTVFWDHPKANSRLEQRYNSTIGKGVRQASGVADYIRKINDNVAIFTDKKHNFRFQIDNVSRHKIYKVVVTLDDFVNLAETKFTDKTTTPFDTLIITLPELERIMWKCGSDVDKFLRFLRFRYQNKNYIVSINASELDHFGFFVNKNGGTVKHSKSGIQYLGKNFSSIFDEYDRETVDKTLIEFGIS